MKLRTRLFLWVGLIFILAFGISLYFETYLTDRNVDQAETELRDELLHLNNERRKNMEKYLHVSLAEEQALIDSLLLRISRDPKLGASLFIDPENMNMLAPAYSAFLYKNDRWIDFLQTTKNGELTSLMIPIEFPMLSAHRVPIDERLSWVLLSFDKELDRPFMGVKLAVHPTEKRGLGLSIDEMIDIDWGLTILFTPEELAAWEQKPLPTKMPVEALDVEAFLEAVRHAKLYLKNGDGTPQWIREDIQKRSGGKPFQGIPFDSGIQCLKNEGDVLNNRIIQLLQRGDQAIMLSSLATLFASGEFGAGPLSRIAPKGISRFPGGAHAGHLLLSSDVFFDKKTFNDEAYFKAHPSNRGCDGLGSSIAIIKKEDSGQVFLGNALQIKGGKGSGFLTVGVDAENLLQDLVLTVHRDAFLVHGGEVISAFDSEGEGVNLRESQLPQIPKLLKEETGVMTWKGEQYYFLHITPFASLDLHFFFLEPEKKAFALVNTVKDVTKEVVDHVSYNMRLIAVAALILVLLLLHRVARRITKPITQLATLTEHVASGRLEDIELPEPPKGRHDEIVTLCHSFEKMVTGLKEKEKVKGVLNKVVSPQIAQEILKGTVHLGGEEKKVTVLFADIRSFTHLTANMAPTDVIELLNKCMTIISHVIDEHGGVIDKYVGDEVMALFGAPLEKEDSALRAVQCGLKVLSVLNEWNQERKANGQEPVEMGIGIHTGVVLAGNMGAENRLNYTVLGRNVNFASRLCSEAKPMEVLISRETLEEPHVSEHISVEELPPVSIKGFDTPFTLFSVKGEKDA